MNNAAADWASEQEDRASWDRPDARCEGCGIICERDAYLCEVCAEFEIEDAS